MKNTETTPETAKFNVGDTVALGSEFPAFQRGWPARIEHVYDFNSEFDGSRLYSVKFFRIPNLSLGSDGGWLNVSELNLVPLAV